MRIALINENSQAAKNSIIEKALRKVVEPMGFEVLCLTQAHVTMSSLAAAQAKALCWHSTASPA